MRTEQAAATAVVDDQLAPPWDGPHGSNGARGSNGASGSNGSTGVATQAGGAPARDRRPDQSRLLLRVAGVYAASRLASLLYMWMSNFAMPMRLGNNGPAWPVFGLWDAEWYTRLIVEGYPTSVPPGEGPVAMTTIAFFPGFPLIARAVYALTGWSAATSGAVVSMLGGLVACLMLWKLVDLLDGPAVATRAATLFCFMPGAFAFSIAYSEGVFLAAATTSMYGLLAKRWWLAGLAAALASGTRPTGFIMVGCCGWVALGEFIKNRSWRPFIAPLLAPIGFVGYFVYLHFHTGSIYSWTETEKRGWEQHFNFGASLVHVIRGFFESPFASVIGFFAVTAVFALVAFCVLAARRGLPSVLVLYTIGIMVFPLGDAIVISTQRYLLSAFPVVIPFARALRGASFTLAAAVSGTTMILLLVLATITGIHVP